MTLENSHELLEFRAVIDIIVKLANSTMEARHIEELAPLTQPSEIQRHFDLIKEWLQLSESGNAPRFSELPDCSLIFERLEIQGCALEGRELLQLSKVLLCTQSTKSLLKANAAECPNLREIEHQLPLLNHLTSAVAGKINESGEVEDNASPELKRLRNETNVIRGRLYRALEDISSRHNVDQVLQDEVITIRNERFVIPVRAEKRKELNGVVHGTSSSGLTIFVEPLETIELNNQMVRLREQAAEEVRRILRSLTEQMREHLAELRQAAHGLGVLDSILARARFAQDYRCTLPRINQDEVFSISGGRHPALEKTLRAQGKDVVPISLRLDRTRQILVISGPNTGGKTVALKTVGLLALMALSGIPVPAEAADFCVFRQILADIGDRQSIAENLSTFSSHLINIRSILGEAQPPALVLLDELGTGTDPAEGSALGVAIVESLRNKGIMSVVTTHHNGLKMYASSTLRVSNACMEFDEATLQPTFRLLDGIPGSSSGIEIARRLGLEENLLDHARGLISEEEKAVALYSRQLREQIASAEQVRRKLELERVQLEERRRGLELKYLKRAEQKQRQVEQYWQDAFADFQQETRRLVAEIKDKYLSVKVLREIECKTARLRERSQTELAELREDPSPPRTPVQPECLANLRAGSRVRVRRFGQTGIVTTHHKEDEWEVAVGSIKCVLRASELEVLQPAEASLQTGKRGPSHITVHLSSPELAGNEINLTGCTVEEAIRQTDKFLDQAYLASVSPVRLIHGFGMGVLKRALSEWLAAQSYVEEFHAAPPQQGGNAVTIVSLKS